MPIEPESPKLASILIPPKATDLNGRGRFGWVGRLEGPLVEDTVIAVVLNELDIVSAVDESSFASKRPILVMALNIQGPFGLDFELNRGKDHRVPLP